MEIGLCFAGDLIPSWQRCQVLAPFSSALVGAAKRRRSDSQRAKSFRVNLINNLALPCPGSASNRCYSQAGKHVQQHGYIDHLPYAQTARSDFNTKGN